MLKIKVTTRWRQQKRRSKIQKICFDQTYLYTHTSIQRIFLLNFISIYRKVFVYRSTKFQFILLVLVTRSLVFSRMILQKKLNFQIKFMTFSVLDFQVLYFDILWLELDCFSACHHQWRYNCLSILESNQFMTVSNHVLHDSVKNIGKYRYWIK